MKTADNSLEIGAVLDNRYKVEGILGIGGFGITYKAHDDTLNCTVVIKEYLPEECGARDNDTISVIPRTNRQNDFEYGLEKYLEEAQVLAKFNHANIVRVTNFIKANGTAYIIMAFEDGIALDEWLKKKSDSLDEKIILQIIVPILKGLAEVHKTGLMHRDIKPGNIFLRKTGGPMLIDFGAARQALGEHSKSISAIISMGYAPPEQYTTRGKQGAYTDLYAVGAVLYKLIVGTTPVESPDRSHAKAEEEDDPLIPAIEAGKGKVSDWLLEITDQLLNISPKQRPQNAEDVLIAIENKTKIVIKAAAAPVENSENSSKTRVVKSSDRFANQSKSKEPSQATEKTESKNKAPLIVGVFALLAAISAGGWWFSQQSTGIPDSTSVKQEAGVQPKSLAQGQAILYVSSKPSGAVVYLDEHKIGTTPYKGEGLPSGSHQLKLVHDEYSDHRDSITLNDNIIIKKNYKLSFASGNLSIFSQPEGAHIFIDGKDTKQVTPATLLDINAGDRQLKLHKDKFYDFAEIVRVKKEKTIRVDYSLKGGNLVKYKRQWVEPDERDRLIAQAREEKRLAEVKEAERVKEAKRRAEIKEAKRVAERKEAERIKEEKRIADKNNRAQRHAGKMIRIPAGSFKMGSKTNDNELPIHNVRLSSFQLGQYEITQKQWVNIMGDNPSKFTNCDNCPVEQVNWDDIQKFIKKLNRKTGMNYRLPSEAEWEYACRNGGKITNDKDCNGSNPDSSYVAWDSTNSDKKTHPVGQKGANALGLYDISGNVWEWVQDCWDESNESYNGAPSNGDAWFGGNCKMRVLRGGSWFNEKKYLRSTYRNRYKSDLRYSSCGFRLAHD